MDTFPEFPVAPRAFDGASRKVDAGAGFEWLRQGWAMFAANPGVWVVCAVLTLVILVGLSMVPLIGQLATHLLLPLFGAGLLHLCRRQSEGATPDISDLFIGFKKKAGDLAIVGLIYALSVLVIAVIVALAVGGVVQGTVIGLGVVVGSVLLAILLITVLSMPVFMAVWFAPALVFFNHMAPVDALKASFFACLKNWLPFLIYGIILAMLFIFSALLLGLGFLVLIPVLSGALYASYRDVFVAV